MPKPKSLTAFEKGVREYLKHLSVPRDRDAKFIEDHLSRQQLNELWDQGWSAVLDTLSNLTDSDLSRQVTLRTETMTAFAAIIRQLSHYAYHVGQLILLAKHIRGAECQYITIPRGQSNQFNKQMGMKATS